LTFHDVRQIVIPYSLLTFSILSADWPSSFSTMAMWVRGRRGAKPVLFTWLKPNNGLLLSMKATPLTVTDVQSLNI
jgi:hypothetical protein